MTQARRRIVLALLSLLGLAALFLWLQYFHGRRALRAYKAGLVAQGEKLTIEASTPPPAIEAQRSADDFLQAAWQLLGAIVPRHPPGAMKFISPGKASIGWQQTDVRDAKSTNTWQQMAEDLKTNAAALEQNSIAAEGRWRTY